jgi:hypothetical protein
MSFKIGNYFEYEYNNILRYSKKIVGDTIVQSIGCHYYKIEYRYPINNNPAIWFERIDSIGDWYTYLASTQQQCRIYQLTIPLHSSFLNCSALFYISLEDTFSLSSILGDYGPFYVRKYYQGSLAPKDDYIARKFQLYYSYSYEVNNHTNLVGAIIDSIVYGSITGIKKEASLIPSEYKLFQNYPNPFNPKTLIKFSIPEYSYIKILVSDLMGREVLTLYKDYINPGENQIEFDGSDLASGVYFCQLQTENIVKTIKMILIK